MTMTQLTYFISTVSLNSMTKVAEQFHVSQPAVSSAIRELEAEFNVQLFYRVKRDLILTPEGIRFYHKALALVEHFNTVQREGMELLQQKKICSIAFAPNISVLYMPKLYQYLSEHAPDVTIEMHENRITQTLELINSGMVDIAFMANSFPEDSPFTTIPVATFHMHACMTDKLAKFPTDTITFKDIGSLPLLLQWRSTYHNKALRSRFEEIGIVPNIKFEVSQVRTVEEILLRGLAAAFLPGEMFSHIPEIRAYEVVGLNSPTIYLVYKKRTEITDIVIKLCRSFFRQL